MALLKASLLTPIPTNHRFNCSSATTLFSRASFIGRKLYFHTLLNGIKLTTLINLDHIWDPESLQNNNRILIRDIQLPWRQQATDKMVSKAAIAALGGYLITSASAGFSSSSASNIAIYWGQNSEGTLDSTAQQRLSYYCASEGPSSTANQ